MRWCHWGAALVAVASIFGCVGSDSPPPSDGVETFANPPELTPDARGVYQLRFGPSAVQIAGRRYCLRAYNGSVPGPTLRLRAGTDRRVHVDLHNDFTRTDGREVSGMEGRTRPTCHDFNITNLHFHGGHVQPNFATVDPADPCVGEGCGPDGRYLGDNVLQEVRQGESARYRWDLDEDGTHHEGTDWYHPHIHGATAIQVVNGAAGALIVEGPLDAEPTVAATRERVMVINEIPYTHETTTPLADGEACTEANLSINNFLSVTEGMPILINGRVKPRLITAPGQVERWRMIYAGSPDEMGITLHPGLDAQCERYDPLRRVELTQYARDGITLPRYYRNPVAWVSPGYRIDAFVPMPTTPQTLCLVGRRTHDLAGSVIAVVEVRADAPPATATAIPPESVISAHAPPVTWEGQVDGATTQVSCESVNRVHQRVGLLMPPVALPGTTQLSHGDRCVLGGGHGHAEEGSVCECPSPNINCRNFDQRRARGYRSDRVAVLGQSERWEVVATDGHPFHIHINPFVMCPNDSNKEPNFAHWRDTLWVQVDDRPRQLLMNFRGFAGSFVAHCHKLNHEDEGMMELVEICRPEDRECQCQRTDATGACVSQAGCQADDRRCEFAA
ncbi:MAG: multicopper oxidase domain-containing protein, partial [Polyangiales bacterium]